MFKWWLLAAGVFGFVKGYLQAEPGERFLAEHPPHVAQDWDYNVIAGVRVLKPSVEFSNWELNIERSKARRIIEVGRELQLIGGILFGSGVILLGLEAVRRQYESMPSRTAEGRPDPQSVVAEKPQPAGGVSTASEVSPASPGATLPVDSLPPKGPAHSPAQWLTQLERVIKVLSALVGLVGAVLALLGLIRR